MVGGSVSPRRWKRGVGASLSLMALLVSVLVPTAVLDLTAVPGPQVHRARLALDASVARSVPLTAEPDDPYFSQQWALQAIGAPSAWAATTGTGITVAVVDTGVDLGHPDLTGQMVPGVNLVDPGQPPSDDNGHGTALAGIIAASTDNGIGVAGVAPHARIMPVKALDADGRGSASTVDAGIEWAAAHGARVINLSFGDLLPGDLPPGLRQAVATARSDGAICVLAAGNDPQAVDTYPDADAVVVGAATEQGTAAAYSSSVGDAPWAISAPGGGGTSSATNVISTYWTPGGGATYASLAGTSMATAFVSGALADLLSLGLTPRLAVQRLLATANPMKETARSGAGELDLAGAVQASVTLAGTGAGAIVAPVPAGRDTAAPSPRSKAPQFSAVGAPRHTAAAPSSSGPAARTRATADGTTAGGGPLRPLQGLGALVLALAAALLAAATWTASHFLRADRGVQRPRRTRARMP
jgi:subtilisin family serine protease